MGSPTHSPTTQKPSRSMQMLLVVQELPEAGTLKHPMPVSQKSSVQGSASSQLISAPHSGLAEGLKEALLVGVILLDIVAVALLVLVAVAVVEATGVMEMVAVGERVGLVLMTGLKLMVPEGDLLGV